MAQAQRGGSIKQLAAENERLRAENEQLKGRPPQHGSPAPSSKATMQGLRKFGVVLFVVLAVLLLILGNILFWFGNTLVKNDRFKQAVTPVIKNTSVQHAVAHYTTAQLYSNVDVTKHVQDALPPRADFLAPTIASQLKGQTEAVLAKILARPQFQDRWNTRLGKAHDRFITTIKQSGGNGSIDLNELYQQLSASLNGTRLSFLAGKQLPSKVGDIQLVSGGWIQSLHSVIVHIDLWRTLAVLLFILFAVLGVLLARRRRRMVALMALYISIGLFITLIAVRLTRQIIAGKVAPQYADAAQQAVHILLHSLVVQTALLLAIFVLVALIAWLTGNGHSARYVQGRIGLLFAGKLHAALFGGHENVVTRWVGRHKRALQWGVVALIALLMLVVQLTLSVLIGYVIIGIVAVLVVEAIGAPQEVQLTDTTSLHR